MASQIRMRPLQPPTCCPPSLQVAHGSSSQHVVGTRWHRILLPPLKQGARTEVSVKGTMLGFEKHHGARMSMFLVSRCNTLDVRLRATVSLGSPVSARSECSTLRRDGRGDVGDELTEDSLDQPATQEAHIYFWQAVSVQSSPDLRRGTVQSGFEVS